MTSRRNQEESRYVPCKTQDNKPFTQMDASSQLYFHGIIPRDVAERRLLHCSKDAGTFLIRGSASKVGNSVLSMVVADKTTKAPNVVHYQINIQADGMVAIDGGPTFPGPVELVEYYKNNQDRLLSVLVKPCNRPNEKVELYKGVTHDDLEEATRVVLKNNDIDNEDAIRSFKIQFEPVIGRILHKEQPWFHGIIPREEAESRMQATVPLIDGSFLIRERGQPPGTFALVLAFQTKLYHYLFEKNQNGQLSIKSGRLFENLMGVVSFYSQNSEGLWHALSTPVDVKQFQYRPRTELHARNVLLNTYIQECLNKELLRKPSKELNKFKTSRRGPPAPAPRPPSTPLPPPPAAALPSAPRNDTWKTEKIYDTTKLIQTAGYIRQTAEKSPLQLDQNRLRLEQELGHGNFGSVMKGIYIKDNGQKINVAVKTLKEDDLPNQKEEVLAEAQVMAKLDHPHIVRLIGVVRSPNLMIVMEIAPLGQLNKYLKKNRNMSIPQVLLLMLQVSEGMDYLESQHFVHRDLAARNVLVVSDDFVKISDFGMSRATGAGNEYYRAERAGRWPLKWYAPECIYHRKFSSKGDVWSYGVTLWEATSYGKRPFEGLKGPDIVNAIEEGRRLPQPPDCPDAVYAIMHDCWQYNEQQRPTFNEVGSRLHRYLQNAGQNTGKSTGLKTRNAGGGGEDDGNEVEPGDLTI